MSAEGCRAQRGLRSARSELISEQPRCFLKSVNSIRSRFAGRREEAAQLIATLPVEDRAIWATAMYGGLRAGELMALRRSDVDLATGLIRVERAWDSPGGRGRHDRCPFARRGET